MQRNSTACGCGLSLSSLSLSLAVVCRGHGRPHTTPHHTAHGTRPRELRAISTGATREGEGKGLVVVARARGAGVGRRPARVVHVRGARKICPLHVARASTLPLPRCPWIAWPRRGRRRNTHACRGREGGVSGTRRHEPMCRQPVHGPRQGGWSGLFGGKG